MRLTEEIAQTLVGKIVEELPGEWELDTDTFAWCMVARAAAEGGEALCFDPLRSQGRLAISGGFGPLAPYLPYRSPRCKITVDAGREPASIARDIERRLLPSYREVLATARQRKAEHEARVSHETSVTQEIIAALGGTVRVKLDNHNAFSGTPAAQFHAGAGNLYVSGRVSEGYGIHLELHGLSLAQVRHLIDALAVPQATQQGVGHTFTPLQAQGD